MILYTFKKKLLWLCVEVRLERTNVDIQVTILEMQLSMNADDDLDLGGGCLEVGAECLRLTAAQQPLHSAYHAHVTARIPVHWLIRQVQALPINKIQISCLRCI